MSSWNNVNVVLTNNSGYKVLDLGGFLSNYDNLSFQTLYGFGGRYGVCRFDLGLNPLQYSYYTEDAPTKITLYNFTKEIYEGQLIGTGLRLSPPSGLTLHAAGYWGQLLGIRSTGQDWADDRTTEAVWPVNTSKNGAEKCFYDRHLGRLRFTPKAEQWANNDVAALAYFPAWSASVLRVTFDYDFAENSPTTEWKLSLYDVTNAAEEWSVTATGTGSVDQVLTTASTNIEFRFTNVKGSAQTPPSDGTEYGEITNLMVYTEDESPNDITLETIANDAIGDINGLSADTDHISTASDLALEPFITGGQTPWNEVLTEAAKFGDTSFNTYAVGVLGSWEASDGNPVLFTEQWPAVTDWDLVGDVATLGNVKPYQDFDAIRNYIIINYRDKQGELETVDPTDYATLRNQDSIDTYGRRHGIYNIRGSYTEAEALNLGRRILSDLKDPIWRVTSPVTAFEKIRLKGGGYIGTSEVYAGQRLRVTDHINDITGRTGATFVITKTDYTHNNERVAMTLERPDSLAIRLAQGER